MSDSTIEPLQLGTRVRTTTSSSRSLFRRYPESAPAFEYIPKGVTGKVIASYLEDDGYKYDVMVDLIDCKVNRTFFPRIEVIGDDVPVYGKLYAVYSQTIADEMFALKDVYEAFDKVLLGADDRVEIYFDEEHKTYLMRWNAETQEIVNRLLAELAQGKAK